MGHPQILNLFCLISKSFLSLKIAKLCKFANFQTNQLSFVAKREVSKWVSYSGVRYIRSRSLWPLLYRAYQGQLVWTNILNFYQLSNEAWTETHFLGLRWSIYQFGLFVSFLNAWVMAMCPKILPGDFM